MKRSIAVSLVIMGAATALTACENKNIESAVFETVEECSISANYSRDRCEKDFAEAKKSHDKYAPAYSSQKDCELEFGPGKCEGAKPEHSAASAPGGSSMFVPMMLGYMMGSSMGGSSSASAAVAPQSLYKTRGRGHFVNSNGAQISQRTGNVRLKGMDSVTRPPMAQTRTLARGGFGSRSMSIAG